MDGPLDVVLFDFGDTLAQEPFCVQAPPGCSDWREHVLAAYAEEGLAARWCAGETGFDAVVARVAARCALPLEATRAAMQHDWRHLRWNERTAAFARELGRAGRAALVTVNPEAFLTCIVPHHDLDRDFGVIVGSWEERTNDKVRLCERALERLGAPQRSAVLLVDNDARNVEAWQAAGGEGHWYRGDAAFAVEIPALRARLARGAGPSCAGWGRPGQHSTF